MRSTNLQETIRALAEPTVQRLGFDLVAVEWLSGSGGRVLRLSIDGPLGVSASDCALVSEQLSPLLDASDPIDQRYNLEVSSPGIDRPIQRRSDFERFRGYRVRLRLSEGPPRRRYAGTIGEIDKDELLVSVDGQEHRIPLDLIESAHLVLTLEEYQKLGAPDAG